MIPSIWTSMFAFAPAVEQPAELAAAGFRFAELSCEAVVDPEANCLTRPHAERLRAAYDTAGVRMLQVHFPIVTFNPEVRVPAGQWSNERLTDFAHPVEARREFELRAAEELLALCPLMGIEVMVVHPGGLVGWEKEDDLRRIHRQNLEAFRRLAPIAARNQVIVAVENMGRAGGRASYGADIDQLVALVDEIGSPHVGICLDTSHANYTKVDIPAAIRKMGRRIVATHVSDNLGEHDDHLFPYSGRIQWQGVVDALREIGYARLFNLETPGENRCPPEVVRLKGRHVRELLERMLDR